MSEQKRYYSLHDILKRKAIYNVIIGERSNGKTYSVLKYAIENYFKTGGQFAYLRRYDLDIQGRRATMVFSTINDNGVVAKASNGKYQGITYYAGKYYFYTLSEDGKQIYNMETDVFGYTFSLAANEHNKSISYPRVTTVLFDEFISKTYYPDEFVIFVNSLSTIIRQRENVTIFMLGNTVNKFCPYFKEMGLKHVLEMKQGTIDVYKCGQDGKTTIAVEYCASMEKQKENNYYFTFDNPQLQMITSGAWELGLYPHLPEKYKPKQIVFTFFIIFNDETYQCEIIENERAEMFIYIHQKSTPLQDTDNDLIYSLDYNYKLNWNRSIFKPINKLQKNIEWFFKTDRVFYQDNSVGDAINNYLKICRTQL